MSGNTEHRWEQSGTGLTARHRWESEKEGKHEIKQRSDYQNKTGSKKTMDHNRNEHIHFVRQSICCLDVADFTTTKKRNNPVWCVCPSPYLVPPVSSYTPYCSPSPQVSGSVKVLCLPVRHFSPSWKFVFFFLLLFFQCLFTLFMPSFAIQMCNLRFNCNLFVFIFIISTAELRSVMASVSSLGSRGFFCNFCDDVNK